MAVAKDFLAPLFAASRIIAYGGSDSGSAPAGWLYCNGASVSRATYPNLFALMSAPLALSTTSSSVTATTTSTAGLAAGMAIEGTGVAANTTISAVVNGTTLTLSLAATATSSVARTLIPFGAASSTTFNTPDLRSRVPLSGTGAAATTGLAAGTSTFTLTTAHMPAHTHQFSDPTHTHSIADGGSHYHDYDPGLPPANVASNSLFGSAGAANRRAPTAVTTATGATTVSFTTDPRNPFPATTGSSGAGGSHTNEQPWIATNYLIAAS